jgi:hypothetical protein
MLLHINDVGIEKLRNSDISEVISCDSICCALTAEIIIKP